MINRIDAIGFQFFKNNNVMSGKDEQKHCQERHKNVNAG